MGELTPAPKGYPIKLVRDETANIINSTGDPGDLWYAELQDGEQLNRWLAKKLIEEATEYVVDGGIEELADVLAVVEGLAARHGMTLDGLCSLVAQDKRGGFLTGQMMYGYHAEFDGLASGGPVAHG